MLTNLPCCQLLLQLLPLCSCKGAVGTFGDGHCLLQLVDAPLQQPLQCRQNKRARSALCMITLMIELCPCARICSCICSCIQQAQCMRVHIGCTCQVTCQSKQCFSSCRQQAGKVLHPALEGYCAEQADFIMNLWVVQVTFSKVWSVTAVLQESARSCYMHQENAKWTCRCIAPIWHTRPTLMCYVACIRNVSHPSIFPKLP